MKITIRDFNAAWMAGSLHFGNSLLHDTFPTSLLCKFSCALLPQLRSGQIDGNRGYEDRHDPVETYC